MKVELTILMPCLNEERTIGFCIEQAKLFLDENDIVGEILIVDNGSVDRSVGIASKLGARVVVENKKGYGNALIRGFLEAKGEYVIYGDCDASYDFYHLDSYLEKLREGYDFVNGNRYLGGIEKGAMPFSHYYIGVPFLSFLGRIAYKVPFYDFHCGLRGFKRSSLPFLQATGMEFATEIVYKFRVEGKKMIEIPTTLAKDRRIGRSHLRTIRDGVRHVYFIFKTWIR